MPIQVPNSNGTFSDLKEIYVGRDSISKVYSGSDLVWAKDIVQVSLPSSTNYNTDLRKNWLSYNQWRNQTGNCYFQINGWEINKIKCPTLSGMRSKSGTNKSNSEFEANYMASPVYKHGGKYYTLISDSSVVNGYFPLTVTFQTYSLGRSGDNAINNMFFFTTAGTTSNGGLLTTSHTSSDLLRVRDDIKKSHVYLIPNSNTQRNITIGAKTYNQGSYDLADYAGSNPQLFDNDVTPMFGQFSGRDINSKSGRVIPIANDSGLDTKRGDRDNTRNYWENFSNNDTVFDQSSFNCQISVTMMAKVSDWTDKDISFVQIYSTDQTGNSPASQFNFSDIRSMQKVNFCLLTESQYIDKVAGDSFSATSRVNYTNFPQTAFGNTEDLSTYTRWRANSPQPPANTVIEDTTDDNAVPEVQVVEPLDTADVIPDDLGHLQFRYYGTQGRLEISFESNGTITLNAVSDGGKILAGDDLTQIASNETGNVVYFSYRWHEQTNSLVGEKYEISATHESGYKPGGPIGDFKSLGSLRKFSLIANSESQSTIKFRLRKVADQSIVSEWTTLLDVYQDPNVTVGGGEFTGGVQTGGGSSTSASLRTKPS
tara:strand:- start:11413 stop:13203 length:1791 start_codon:yes stop_codon:yes gene_type:complete